MPDSADALREKAVDVAALFDGDVTTETSFGVVLCQAWEDARCVFIRVMAAQQWVCGLGGAARVERPACGGWLVQTAAEPGFCYWLPAMPICRRIDAHGHVLEERASRLSAASWGDGQAMFTLAAAPAGMVIDMVLWRLPVALVEELRHPTALETQPAYLWGSHTVVGKAADLYLHLVQGRVHENRWAWPFKIRGFSENDGHAVGVQLTGLQRASGRALPALLGRQVLAAVLRRIGSDGAYRHGVWTDRMESHYRLHCSAMHLMMDTLAAGPDPAVERALRAAAGFLAAQHERIAVGIWFLHDELELSDEAMQRGPFKWVPSRALGKRSSNMLVLNTQLDTCIALDRYAQLTGDTKFAPLIDSAQSATRAVLGLCSAEPLYRALMWMIELTFLPAPKAAALPVWKRALKRVAWKYLIPRMPDLKARLPRLVMPGGYIDRELTLRSWAHDYHAINLMDLARYLRRFDCQVVRQVLIEGLAFTRRSGILERWREMPYQKYALGFWAEALYHVCTIFPDEQYRQWLAEAMLVLEAMQMGQPPSLLGANAEAVSVPEQMPCPSPRDGRLRIANLGRRGAPELLIVNPTDSALPLDWELPPSEAVAYAGCDARPVQGEPPAVPARGWLWARSSGQG